MRRYKKIGPAEIAAGALRFEQLPSPLVHLPPETLSAIAASHELLAALARQRAEQNAASDAIWRRAPEVYDRAGARQAKALALIKRNREVMRLATRGWSNELIGKRMKLHQVTVSKIVQRVLRGQG